MAPKLPVRNKGYFQTVSVKNGQGSFDGHKLSEAFDDVGTGIGNVANRLSSNMDGSASIPPDIANFQAQHLGSGNMDFAITDNNPNTTSAVLYHLEYADNAGFSNSTFAPASASRNPICPCLPNGKWWFKAYSQYQYGGTPSKHMVVGPITVTGSPITGTKFASQGSGTGHPGQTGVGFGLTITRG